MIEPRKTPEDTDRRRRAVVAAAFLTLLWSAGCGLGSVGPCAGLSEKDAAELLELSANELTREAGFDRAISCTFSKKDAEEKALAFSVHVEESVSEAVRAMAKIVRGYNVHNEVEHLADMGHEAMWLQSQGSRRKLLLRDGLVWIEIDAPSERDQAIRLAELLSKNIAGR